MALLAYNKTAAPLALAAGGVTLVASTTPGQRGPAVNVTSELRPNAAVDPVNGIAGGLAAGSYTALEAQRSGGDVDFEWTGDPQYAVASLTVGGPTAGTHAASHVTGGVDVIPNVVAAGNSGLMTGADKTKLDGVGTAAPPGSRTISAAGLATGGGDLSADRTITVTAGLVGDIMPDAVAAVAGVTGRAADAGHIHPFGALPVYSNAGRPAASSLAAGYVIFNTDDKKPNYSDGINWYDAAGNLT